MMEEKPGYVMPTGESPQLTIERLELELRKAKEIIAASSLLYSDSINDREKLGQQVIELIKANSELGIALVSAFNFAVNQDDNGEWWSHSGWANYGKQGMATMHRGFATHEEALASYKRLAGIEKAPEGRRPTVVCLCGSTKFWREFQRASLRETMAGRIVLSIGCATGTDDEHFGNMPAEEYERIKKELDELHKRKIDLADEVLILNDFLPWCSEHDQFRVKCTNHEECKTIRELRPYTGESTRSELQYAIDHGKRVRWLYETDKVITIINAEIAPWPSYSS